MSIKAHIDSVAQGDELFLILNSATALKPGVYTRNAFTNDYYSGPLGFFGVADTLVINTLTSSFIDGTFKIENVHIGPSPNGNVDPPGVDSIIYITNGKIHVHW